MFSRRWIINYLLIVLIVVFTYVGNRYGVETGFQPSPTIVDLNPADIETVDIQTADALLSLKRDQGDWTIQSPIRWPANSTNVGRLLNIANSRTESRLSAEEIDLATLGLQFPQAILRLNETQVSFGATNNIGERRYTMIGSMVFLLPDVHLPFITQGLTGLVDRRLLPPRFELESLRLPGIDISLDDKHSWRIKNENRYPQAQIDSLAENWQNLEASQIRVFDTSAMPRQKIILGLKDGRQFEYFVLSIDPEIVIANPEIGLQYHFRSSHYYGLISLRADNVSG